MHGLLSYISLGPYVTRIVLMNEGSKSAQKDGQKGVHIKALNNFGATARRVPTRDVRGRVLANFGRQGGLWQVWALVR